MLRPFGVVCCLAVVAASTALLLGCAPRVTVTGQPVESAPVTPPSTMPDLMGERVGDAVKGLAALPGTATVSFPATTVAMVLGERQVAGVTKPPASATIKIDERVREITDLDFSDGHVVIEQSPAPGTALAPSTSVRLVAGPHPGPAGEVWLLQGHVQVLKRDGADPCFTCHTPKECTDCHTKYLE